MIRFVAAILVVVASACGGGSDAPDLGGMYQVTYHTRGDTSCTTEGAPVSDYAFFQMVDGFIDGFEIDECDTSDPQSCRAGIIDFPEAGDGGWYQHAANTQTGGGTTCNLYRSEYSAVVMADGSLRIELRDWAEYGQRSEADCTLDAAESLSGDANCELFEVITGAPL